MESKARRKIEDWKETWTGVVELKKDLLKEGNTVKRTNIMKECKKGKR